MSTRQPAGQIQHAGADPLAAGANQKKCGTTSRHRIGCVRLLWLSESIKLGHLSLSKRGLSPIFQQTAGCTRMHIEWRGRGNGSVPVTLSPPQ
jgi:hypothetical protein